MALERLDGEGLAVVQGCVSSISRINVGTRLDPMIYEQSGFDHLTTPPTFHIHPEIS